MGKRFSVASVFLVALAFSAACGVHQTEAPALAGPSELATSMVITATPDSITQDGASQASITVFVRDANAKPMQGLAIRIDMAVNGTIQDFGTLSARTIVTGSDGKAFAIYTAPPAPPPSVGGSSTRVQVVVRAIGTNAQVSAPQVGPASILQSVDIRLVPPGVIQAPAGTPTAAFTMSPTPVLVNVPVTFDASTSSIGTGATQITSYAWTFGDGTSGTGRTVTHTFTVAATFNVTVTVTNDRGLSASSTLPVTVGSSTGGSTAFPTATFTFSPSAPGVGATVFFNASTSSPGTGHTIASYAWTFGDGSSGAGVNPTHAYGTSGSFGVQLTVTDEAGQSTTSAPTAISVGSNSLDPTSNFTFSPSSPGRNDQVVFDASSSTIAQGQTITDVAWNFGDGTAVIHCATAGPVPPATATDCPGPTNRISAHTFTTNQSFIVNLVVTDSAGRTGAHNTNVTVALAQPTVVITTSPGSPNPTTTVSFNSNGTTYFPGSGPSSFSWTFGDGFGCSTAVSAGCGLGSPANPTHVYGAIGAYGVGLSVTDNKGRTGVGNATVTVVAPPPPVAAISSPSPNPVSVAAGGVISFDGGTSTSSAPLGINNYRWNFGDGAIISGAPAGVAPDGGTNQAPKHHYTTSSASPLTVTLTVTDANGTGSSTVTVTVNP